MRRQLCAFVGMTACLLHVESFEFQTAFRPLSRSCKQHQPTVLLAKAAAAGGGGFGAKKTVAPKKMSKQAVLKKIKKTYGGTSPKEVAEATQKRVESAIQDLPPHLYVATQLYQQLQKWNTQYSRLSILQQANLPQQEVDSAQRAQAELQKIYDQHDLTENDLHNIFQKITWDASADAKAARAITGNMAQEISDRVDAACQVIAQAVLEAGENGRCLDVGCGFGVLVPYLTKAGVARQQIHGVDLSPEMIRNAEEQHPGIHFEAADFLKEYQDALGFDGVIFCSALHDMPSPLEALQKAASLVRPKGKLVIVHAQGASHVQKQVSSNPVLVKRGLPNANELRDLGLDGFSLVIEPQVIDEGYLAVFQKQG
jgi:2-polyprenyl-3-methyl-5-hydroxy-6-metoxy-1,4-benzoquinol methylase